jgi:hypothetical protein
VSGESGPRRTRAYALAAPRTEPEAGEEITMHSTIRTTAAAEEAKAVPEEWQAVLRMCAPPGIAVAEVAARMRMRLTPTVVLVGELLAHGLVHHQPPVSDAGASTIPLLHRIRRGLAAL